jgi:hypothetical protein
MQHQPFAFGGPPAEQRSSGPGWQSQLLSPPRHMAAPFPLFSPQSGRPRQADDFDAPSTARRSAGCRDQDRPRRAFVAGPRLDAEASPFSTPAVRSSSSGGGRDQQRQQQQHGQQEEPSGAGSPGSPGCAEQQQQQQPSARHKRALGSAAEAAQQPGKRMRLSLSSLAAALPCPHKLDAYGNDLGSPGNDTSPLALPALVARKALGAAAADSLAAGKRSRGAAFDRLAPGSLGCAVAAAVGSSPKRLRF